MMVLWDTKNRSDFGTEGELEYKLYLWLSIEKEHFPYVALIYIRQPSRLYGFALMNFPRVTG